MGALTTINWAVTDVPFRKGQEAYIEFGKGCALLNSQGVTQQEIADRYEMSQSGVAQAISVGGDKRIITSSNTVLPKSQRSLYLLTTLPDEDFEYVVEEFGENTRQIDIHAVKAGFDTAEEYRGHLQLCKDWQEAINENRRIDNAKRDAEEKAQKQAAEEAVLLAEAEERDATSKSEQEYIPVFRRVDSREFLVHCFQHLLLEGNPAAIKAVKSMFSSLYHPDTGKIRKDTSLMSEINQAIDSLS